jgi:hypothetical protein
MLQLQLDVRPQTAQRLQAILAHAQDEESFAQSIIAYQISELHKAVLNIRLDLQEMEAKHQQASAQFYQQYMQGKAGDSEEAMLWAGLYELLLENESRLRELA